MIEARDNGESSMAGGGTNTDIWPVEGWVGGDRGAGVGTGVAEGWETAEVRFSFFETARGIGTGREDGVDRDFPPSSFKVVWVTGADALVVGMPLEYDTEIDGDSSFWTGKEDGGVGWYFRPSFEGVRVTGADGLVVLVVVAVVAGPLVGDIKADRDSNIGMSKKRGDDGGAGVGNGFSIL
jgi:hypothetical protein